MKKCERCGKIETSQYGLWDYCAKCSKNLCDECMEKGCCGSIPAESGIGVDFVEDESNLDE